MTDRELLELAAKSAGITIIEWYGADAQEGPWAVHEPRGPHLGWNPLTDDGDALRLAVQLGLDVLQNPLGQTVCCCGADEQEVEVFEDYGADPYAATRRAIVRAAAEIGRSMK